MSAEADVFDALMSHVEDIPLSPYLPVAWPNFAYEPVVGVPYLEARHLPNDSDRIMISEPTDRMYGILMLTINTPINQGIEDVVEAAGAICEHFATDTRLYSGDTEVRVYRRPTQKEGLNLDGWLKTPILVYYEAFA